MNKREWDSLSGLEKRTVIAERELERLETIKTDLLVTLKEGPPLFQLYLQRGVSSDKYASLLKAWSTKAQAAIAKAEEVP